MEAERVSTHLLVRGRVQGVGFRDFVERTARTLDLDGWVRNRRDGAVEVVAEGPADRIAALMDALARGPALARVDAVEPLPLTAPGPRGRGFEVRPTV